MPLAPVLVLLLLVAVVCTPTLASLSVQHFRIESLEPRRDMLLDIPKMHEAACVFGRPSSSGQNGRIPTLVSGDKHHLGCHALSKNSAQHLRGIEPRCSGIEQDNQGKVVGRV